MAFWAVTCVLIALLEDEEPGTDPTFALGLLHKVHHAAVAIQVYHPESGDRTHSSHGCNTAMALVKRNQVFDIDIA